MTRVQTFMRELDEFVRRYDGIGVISYVVDVETQQRGLTGNVNAEQAETLLLEAADLAGREKAEIARRAAALPRVT